MGKYIVKYENDKCIVSDNKRNYKIDLGERLLDFAVKSIQFLGSIPHKSEYEVFTL